MVPFCCDKGFDKTKTSKVPYLHLISTSYSFIDFYSFELYYGILQAIEYIREYAKIKKTLKYVAKFS